MLVLQCKPNGKISIGDDIELTIVGISGHKVSIGIDAPKDIAILRDNAKKRTKLAHDHKFSPITEPCSCGLTYEEWLRNPYE